MTDSKKKQLVHPHLASEECTPFCPPLTDPNPKGTEADERGCPEGICETHCPTCWRCGVHEPHERSCSQWNQARADKAEAALAAANLRADAGWSNAAKAEASIASARQETKEALAARDGARIRAECAEERAQSARQEIEDLRGALNAAVDWHRFDCPHDAEQYCRCGSVERELYAKAERLVRAALSPAPKDMLPNMLGSKTPCPPPPAPKEEKPERQVVDVSPESFKAFESALETEKAPSDVLKAAFANRRHEPATPEQPEEKQRSLCLECGPDVYLDEDGCCATCGGNALGEHADRTLNQLDSLRAELEKAKGDLWEVKAKHDEMKREQDAANALLHRVSEKNPEAPGWAPLKVSIREFLSQTSEGGEG